MADDLSQTNTIKDAPHNLAAEKAVIGAILFDNEVYNRIDDLLRAADFYSGVHREIYETCADLITKGRVADGVTLLERFQRDGKLAGIGGAQYLADLIDAAAFGPEAADYARLIHDLAVRRSLLRIGSEIVEDAKSPAIEGGGVGQIEAAERKLSDLAQLGAGGRGFIAFRFAVTESVQMAGAALSREGKIAGLASGYRDLDKLLGGFHRSDLVILAGRPSMGKTALATNIAFNIARYHKFEERADGGKKSASGGVVGFFSLEMSSEQLATRILADASKISSHEIRQGRIQPDDYEVLRDAAEEIESMPLYIDDTGGISISQLAARARRLQRAHGLDILVVDYLQLVTASGGRRNDGRVQEVTEITQGLKALAKELNIPVIALSQLSRQVENRDDKRPQLSDLRESGSIEQVADVVMFVYREEYYLQSKMPKDGTEDFAVKMDAWQRGMDLVHGKAEVIIAKQRHGPIDKVTLGFNPDHTRFENLESDYIPQDR
jgi:replicative DNA helicase